MKRRLEDWRIELLLLALLAIAAFLLLEQWAIRDTLWGWVVGLAGFLSTAVASLLSAVVPNTFSDFVAVVLIVIVLLVARWRLRWRILHSPSLTTKACPKCGSELHRIHRNFLDKLIDLLIAPVHRYRCANKQCQWTGLRFDKRRRKRSGLGPEAAEA